MAEITVAMSVLSSAVYEFLKHCLARAAPERDFFEKSLRKSFTKVRDQFARAKPGVWAELTLEKSIQLKNRLIECLQSPEIDRDEILRILKEELKKEGLSSKEAEEFYSRVEDEFVALVNKEALKKPKVFVAILLNECKKHGVRLDEVKDELLARGLVLDTIKSQLDRIEEKIDAMAKESEVIVPTIQSVLRKDRPDAQFSKGMFFRKEPAWVDFEEGFIFERKKVDEIIETLKKCNVHLVVGKPGAGKSVVLKNVGFKLAKRNLPVLYVGLKTYSDKLRPCFKLILRMKKKRAVLIIDDAHLQPSACEEIIRELSSANSKIKVLIGSRPLEEVVRKSPRDFSELEYVSETRLYAKDASMGIINLFLGKEYNLSKGRIEKVSRKFSKYRYDLWVLCLALKAFDPERNLIYEEWIFENIRDSIRGLGQSADDALFPISVFYQYELPFDRCYLTKKMGLEEGVIDRLVEQSEINQIEYVGERRSLCLAHSSIANLYFKTYQSYPSLGEDARRYFQGDDAEYEVFCRYMLESDPTYTLDIVKHLAAESRHRAKDSRRRQNQKLLLGLLRNKEIEDQLRIGINKEKDLDKIIDLIKYVDYIFPKQLKSQLATCLFLKGFKDAILPKLTSETDLTYINSFFRNLNHIKFTKLHHKRFNVMWRFNLRFMESFDLDNLSSKVSSALKKGNSYAALETIYLVMKMNPIGGLRLTEKTDFSKVKEKKDFLKNLFDFFGKYLTSPDSERGVRLRYIILKSNPNLKEDLGGI